MCVAVLMLVATSAVAELQNVTVGDGIRIRASFTESMPHLQIPVLGAHRGGALLWPENTVVAFTEAIKRWPQILLESDACLTKDGQVVLLHDGSVDRTTNGKGKVTDLTLEEIKRLDAGYNFTQDSGKTFPYRGKGLTVPTLAEALAATPNQHWVIEFKRTPGIVPPVIAEVQKANALGRVWLASFKPEFMKEARQLAPNGKFCFDFENGMAMLKTLRSGDWDAYHPGAKMLSLGMEMVDQFKLTKDEVAKLRAKGIVFQLHTPNTREAMVKALDLGANSILTDQPELLQQILDERRASASAPQSGTTP